ncbi:MAG: response regulator [Candidatus Omnitrophota bacterium]|nr:response regulator [Candidatus Omnitrophota bacterium]MDZ4243382.1 response regulator [Candidatus Omnitrophota bacterium]
MATDGFLVKKISEMKRVLIFSPADKAPALQTLLESAGYFARAVTSSRDGSDILKSEPHDLIIVDAEMPFMEGVDFIRSVKSSPVTHEIPVLALVDRARPPAEDLSFRLTTVLVRPFEDYVLLAYAARLLKQLLEPSEEKRPTRVLVAGTDEDVMENMRRQLGSRGCSVVKVSFGADVIKQSVLFGPDLIVLEVQMDGMPSWESIRVLRQMPQFERTPILAYSFYRLSDLGSEDVRQKALSVDAAQKSCLEAGTTAYAGRFNEHTFLSTVEKFLPS